MTKKHFIKMAAIISECREKFPNSESALVYLTTEIASFMRDDNPNFNAEKFMLACHPKGGK
jgi:hypothetical protein